MTKPGLSIFVVKQCLSEVVTESLLPVCLQQHIDDKATVDHFNACSRAARNAEKPRASREAKSCGTTVDSKEGCGGHVIALPLQLQELWGITTHTPGEEFRMEKI